MVHGAGRINDLRTQNVYQLPFFRDSLFDKMWVRDMQVLPYTANGNPVLIMELELFANYNEYLEGIFLEEMDIKDVQRYTLIL